MAAGPGRRIPPCPDRAKPAPPRCQSPRWPVTRPRPARPVTLPAGPLACPAPPALSRPASPVPWVPPARPPLTPDVGRGLPGTILALAAGPRRGCG